MNRTRVLAAALAAMLILLTAPGRAAAAGDDSGAPAAAGAATVAPEAAEGGTAPANAPEFSWSAVYASRYSFQGIDYSDGRPVLQPSASVALRGLTAGFWGNVDQTRREFNEVDLTLQQEVGRGPVSAVLGYAYLHYPNRTDWAPTHEAYLDLGLEAPLAPTLSLHWDVDAGAGRYWTVGLVREFGLPAVTVALSTKLFAQEHYYGMSGIPALETGIALTGNWGPFEFQPAVGRQWTWENGDFRDDLALEPGWLVSLGIAPR